MANLLKLKTAQLNTPVLGTIIHKGESIDIKCETAAGRAWLTKYLHPPTDPLPGFCGFPDRNSMSTVQLNYRGEKEIAFQCHKGDRETPLGPATKYTQLYHWGARAPCVGVWYDKDGIKPGFDPTPSSWMINKQFEYTSWNKDIEKARRTYGSVSIYQDETAFSNRGVITVANFRPDVIDVEVGPTTTIKDLASALKADPKTLKIPRGFVRRETLPNAVEREGYEVIDMNRLTLTPPNKYRIVVISKWPEDESDLLNLSRKAYSGMLRDGAFITSRMAQEVNMFKPGSCFNAVAIYVRDLNEIQNFPLGYPDINMVGEWMDADFAFTWVMYSQMSINTDSSAGLPFNANHILHKWFNGFETSVGLGSALSTFQAACAMEDETALRVANNVLHEAADADVVATNSFATLAKLAIDLAPQAFEWLGNVFGGKKAEEKKEIKKEVKKEIKQGMQPLARPRPRKPRMPTPRPSMQSRPASSKPSVKAPPKPQRAKKMGPKIPLSTYLGKK
jgi:hypothetical protein